MLEYIVYLVFSLIGGSIGFLGAYVMAKRYFTTDKLLEILEELSDEVMVNEGLQKKIYSIGALVGKGIIDGTGLKSNPKRKMGLNDIIMEIAGGFIKDRLIPQAGTPPPQQQSTSELT